jgi:hypothetical protein
VPADQRLGIPPGIAPRCRRQTRCLARHSCSGRRASGCRRPRTGRLIPDPSHRSKWSNLLAADDRNCTRLCRLNRTSPDQHLGRGSDPLAQDRHHEIRCRAAAICTIVAMAYDEELAERIRQLIGSDPELTDKKMFGGLAFLIRGNMAIAASGEGGAMVRVDPAQSNSLVTTTKATLMNMRSRDMPGWLRSVPTICTPTTSSPLGSRWVPGMRARCRPSSSLPERRSTAARR